MNMFSLLTNISFIAIPLHTKQAEARAEFAERSVQKLQKEVDRLEGKTTYVSRDCCFSFPKQIISKSNVPIKTT